ncbi:hypothetical protein ACC691_37010, partial [Rhizobium johnstonii]|uniref:hypothetical protein n=1 Tax=Rhizobium johnstonii TaxID=3019933 RepID=UPI003F98A37D
MPITRRAPVADARDALDGEIPPHRHQGGCEDEPDAHDLVSLTFAAVAFAAGAGAWASFVDRADPERGRRTEQAVRGVTSIALIALAVALVSLPGAGVAE